MKKGKKVTLKQTNAAAIAVQNELRILGLWNENSKLVTTEVYWRRFPELLVPDASGFFFHEVSAMHKIFGFEPGNIYIPQWILNHGFWQDRGSLRDIIRHEYGHALAHYYPKEIINSKSFNKVFGSYYFGEYTDEIEHDAFVSEYARTMPMEDFAETFRVYVKKKGVLPTAIKNKKLIAKWNFIGKTIAKIALK